MPVPGTLAARFLRAHGLSDGLPDIAFHPACKRKGTPSALPALLIAGRRAGEVVALERVFLHPDTAAPFACDAFGNARFAAWQGGEPDRRAALAASFLDAAAYLSLTGKACWSPLRDQAPRLVRFPKQVLEVTIAGSTDSREAQTLDAAREALDRSAYLTRIEMPDPYPSWRARRLALCPNLKAPRPAPPVQLGRHTRGDKGMFTTAY